MAFHIHNLTNSPLSNELLEDLEVLEALENEVDLEDAKKALKGVKKRGTVSWKDTKRELGL